MELNFDNVMSLATPSPDHAGDPMLYFLIDHSAIPGLTKNLDRLRVEWKSLFEGSRDAGALEAAPILVPAARAGRPVASRTAMQWIFDQARFSSSLLMIRTSLDTEALCRRLSLRLDATLRDDMEVLIRYFDARVFESLMLALEPAQKAGFLCVADAWSYVDRSGQLRLEDASGYQEDTDVVPLYLSQEQEARLLELSEPDQICMLINAVMPAGLQEIPPAERFNFISSNAARAKDYGINGTHELALFCCLALTESEFPSAGWEQKLQQLRNDGATLTALVQEQPEDSLGAV